MKYKEVHPKLKCTNSQNKDCTSRRMGGKLVFIREKKDYSVAEFYKKFNDHLPKLVKITHGYDGDIIEETFVKEEVLLIGTISQQRRVLARVISPEGSYRLLSIPSSFNETLHIVSEDGEQGEDTNMCKILLDSKLPLVVKFPKDRHFHEGRRRLKTNQKQIPQMELIKIFEEIHLLGSKLIDGTLDKEVIVHIPLYLPQLRVSVITGIKGYSKPHWKHFMEDIEENSLLVEYDNEYGNQNIGEYKNVEDHPGRMYSYEQPVRYDDIINTFQGRPHEASVKRPLPDPHKAGKMTDNEEVRYETLAFETKSKEKTYEPLSHIDMEIEDSKNVYEDLSWQKNICAKGSTDIPLKPAKVILKDPTFTTDVSNQSLSCGEYLLPISKRGLPDLPVRREKTQEAGWKKTYMNKANEATTRNFPSSSEHINQMEYNKMSDTEFIQPVASSTEVILRSETEIEPKNAPITSEKLNQTECDKNVETNTIASSSNVIHRPETETETVPSSHVGRRAHLFAVRKSIIPEMSVQDIIKYLNELNLIAYKDVFIKQMVDGALLQELDVDVLTKEFGMQKVEALRLLKFAREGHMPKQI